MWFTVITLPVTRTVRVAAAALPEPPTTLPSQTPPANSARITGRPMRSLCGYGGPLRPIGTNAGGAPG